VVFKQCSDLAIWFDRGIQEHVHFVPIANDFSEVAAQVRAARNDDERMQEIVANAQSFAKSNLTDTLISGYVRELLTRYGGMFVV
jgi:hypothetical protein